MKAKTFFIILLVTLTALLILIKQNNKKTQSLYTSAAPITISPIPIETSNIMDSPEGSMTLSLDRKGSIYSLFVTSKSDGQKKQIFQKTEADSNRLEIPYNTWSPDNLYVFLKEKTLTENNYLIFQSSGELFSNSLTSYISIQELFRINIPNYKIEDVTGWAAPNLLIVNTKANESDDKVSFWFDVPSQSFIQLGTYFK
jgi:hypothetical protein